MSDRPLIVAVLGLLISWALPATAQVIARNPQAVANGSAPNLPTTQITGRVFTPNGEPIGNVTVRARNLLSGEIGASTSTASAGQFMLNVSPGSYLLEVVSTGGQIIGTSSFISAAAGTSITAATVTTTAGALSGAATTAGLVSTLGMTAARSVTYAAAAAGVAGVVTPAHALTASPSR